MLLVHVSEGKSMLQFIEDIKSQKRPVVIFGAGIVGEVLFWACQHFKLEVHSFCDNNVNKTKALYAVLMLFLHLN